MKNKIKIFFTLIVLISGITLFPGLTYSQVLKPDSTVKPKNIFNEFNKNKNQNLNQKKVKVNADSLTQNKISKIWEANGVVKIEVSLVKKGVDIKLKVYNMLGKEIKLIYEGTQSRDKEEYQFNSSELPNGFYICILTGSTFRDTEKFIISR